MNGKVAWRGLLAAILSCTAPSLAAENRATFKVQVHVRQSASIDVRPVPGLVAIDPRGSDSHPTVARAMRIAVKAPGALVRLTFAAMSGHVRHVTVYGLGRPVAFGPEGGQMSLPLGEGLSQFEIGYQVVFLEGAPAGQSGPLRATLDLVF